MKKIRGWPIKTGPAGPCCLTPWAAMVWPLHGLGFISDLHLGKSAVFRQAGLAVPVGSDFETWQRLQAMQQELQLKQLVILGDLVHDAVCLTEELWDAFYRFRQQWPKLQIDLVLGNHDNKISVSRWDDWSQGLELHIYRENWANQPGLVGAHEPLVESENLRTTWMISGHLHPAVRIAGGGQRLLLPCFARHHNQWLLPAFGAFTGRLKILPKHYHAIYPVAGDQVFRFKES